MNGKAGLLVEKAFGSILSSLLGSGRSGLEFKACSQADIMEGTDFFLSYAGKKIRVDVTINSEKSHTVWLARRKKEGAVLSYGLRYGNGRVRFNEPVLVILIQSDRIDKVIADRQASMLDLEFAMARIIAMPDIKAGIKLYLLAKDVDPNEVKDFVRVKLSGKR